MQPRITILGNKRKAAMVAQIVRLCEGILLSPFTPDKLISFAGVTTATADKILGSLAVVTDPAAAGRADGGLFLASLSHRILLCLAFQICFSAIHIALRSSGEKLLR